MELVGGVVGKGLGCEDPCVVDNAVDRAELGDRRLCYLLGRRRVTDVSIDESKIR